MTKRRATTTKKTLNPTESSRVFGAIEKTCELAKVKPENSMNVQRSQHYDDTERQNPYLRVR